jgi:mannose/fructose/N-acetylgalactosamine-specific phosphotransferase system component IIB
VSLTLRVDDRLLHGEVLYGQVPALGVRELWLADDRVASSPRERLLYEEQVREVGQGGVLTLAEVPGALAEGDAGERRLLVVRDVEALERLLEGGVQPARVLLGNARKRAGDVALSSSFHATPAELAALKRWSAAGVEVVVQERPGADPVSLEDIEWERIS